MSSDSRNSERVSSQVRVRMADKVAGVTRDVSPSGVFFTIDRELAIGQVVTFTLEFDNPMGRGECLHLDCVGRVVRIEDDGSTRGAAVSITESHLERRPASKVKAVA